MRQLLAVEIGVEWREDMDRDGQSPGSAEQALHIFGPGLDEPADLGSRFVIIDCDGPDADVPPSEVRRLQQRRSERQQVAARARRSFGENSDRLQALQRLGDRNRLILRAFAMGALDVNSAVLVGEPVNERVAELVLRDEGAAQSSPQNKDVEPRGMVGDEQGMPSRAAPRHLSANAENPRGGRQEAVRPRGATK